MPRKAKKESNLEQGSLFDTEDTEALEQSEAFTDLINELNDDGVPDDFKSDEELNQEMEDEEGGDFEEDEESPEESQSEKQTDIGESFSEDTDPLEVISDKLKDLSSSDTASAESFQKMIELQARFNEQFEKRMQKQLDSVAEDFRQRTDLVISEMQSVQKAYEKQTSGIRSAQNKLSRVMMNVERGGEWAEGLNKAVTDGAVEAVQKTADIGVKSIQSAAQKSAMSIDTLEQAANARAKRFMRVTKPEVIVNIAIWIAVTLATAIIIAFCYEFFH